jgi:hypothetical protein
VKRPDWCASYTIGKLFISVTVLTVRCRALSRLAVQTCCQSRSCQSLSCQSLPGLVHLPNLLRPRCLGCQPETCSDVIEMSDDIDQNEDIFMDFLFTEHQADLCN